MKNLVWIASYPRSGNTWLRLFLSFIMSGNQNKDLNHLKVNLLACSRIMFDEIAGVASSELTIPEIRNLKPAVFQILSGLSEDLFLLKTHDSFYNTPSGHPVFPPANSYGCVYIVRNPLDVAVSNAFYFNKSMDEVILDMNNPGFVLNNSIDCLYPLLEEWLGTWSEHVTTWLNSCIRVHIIRYEDMVSNPFETFSNVLEFLDLHYADELIRQTIATTSFEALKKSEEQFGFKEKLQSCDAFFRNGKTGTWKTVLNESQIKKIVTDHHEVMDRFGYTLT
jgi:aryl sulfotransferase